MTAIPVEVIVRKVDVAEGAPPSVVLLISRPDVALVIVCQVRGQPGRSRERTTRETHWVVVIKNESYSIPCHREGQNDTHKGEDEEEDRVLHVQDVNVGFASVNDIQKG